MSAEEFRKALRNRTPEAIAAVRWVMRTTQDPRLFHDAREYLNAA